MKTSSVVVGAIGTDCYAVSCGNRAYLIDPGAEPEKILEMLGKISFDSLRILLTHAHFDHIGAAGAIARHFGIGRVELAPADREIYFSRENAMPPYWPPAEDLPDAGDFLPSPDFKVLPMPGHSPGGSAFLFDSGNGEKVVFVGDSVFAGSIGRTDLWGGNLETLLQSIRREIAVLDDDVILFPGHGPATSVGEEKRCNPYFR
ncbi:MAG: MBL fold metallo-hydrolase [Victivallaceae bacterium]|nr:MBL fold metallo-hydrolase [Victivallaceae bacterium]